MSEKSLSLPPLKELGIVCQPEGEAALEVTVSGEKQAWRGRGTDPRCRAR